MSQDGKPVMSASLVGGENEALERLKKFAAECCAQPNKGNRDNTKNSIYGANFSCKISPWLAMGCLSPRFMLAKLKKTATRYFSCMQVLTLLIISTPGDDCKTGSFIPIQDCRVEFLEHDFLFL